MPKAPTIVEMPAKTLIGMSLSMSRMADKTRELWRSFSPRVAEIGERTNDDRISMQIYPGGPAQVANPEAIFTKWASVEVSSNDATTPPGMASYKLSAGTYAVFQHKGPATDLSTVQYIFTEWLPASREYALDDREHFEVLPADYAPLDPNAREEFWIPVRQRK